MNADFGGAVCLYASNSKNDEFIQDNIFVDCSSSYGGGAFYIYCRDVVLKPGEQSNSDYTVRIYNCNFTNCKSGVEGGAISSGMTISDGESHETVGDNDISIGICYFTKCESAKGGELYFQEGTKEGDEETIILSCTFIDCYATEGEGYAISCGSYKLNIYNNIFTNHNRGTSSNHSILRLKNDKINIADFLFENNSGVSSIKLIVNNSLIIDRIKFNNYNDNVPCINLDDWDVNGDIHFRNCQFTNITNNQCIFDSQCKSNCILTEYSFINISYKSNSINQNYSRIYCTSNNRYDFSECNFIDIETANNGCAIYSEMKSIHLNKCKFINYRSNDDDLSIEFLGSAICLHPNQNSNNKFELNNTIFENCSSLNNGAALSIICDNDYPIEIINSTFTRCISNKKGGAVFIDVNENVNCFMIDNSSFIQCSSEFGGGALFITTNYNSIIKSCSFSSNFVNKEKGGAISINQKDDSQINLLEKFELCLIEKCNFISNKGLDGFAIYNDNSFSNTDINISKNSFIDNYNIETINDSCIILIEMCFVSYEKIVSENSFSNQENGLNIEVNELSCISSPTQITSESVFDSLISFSTEESTATDESSDESIESQSSYSSENSSSIVETESESLYSSEKSTSDVESLMTSSFTYTNKTPIDTTEFSLNISDFQSSESEQLILNGNNSSHKKGIGMGAIIGIVCGIIALVVISSLVAFFVIKNKNKKAIHSPESESLSNKEITHKETSRSNVNRDDDDSDLDFWL